MITATKIATLVQAICLAIQFILWDWAPLSRTIPTLYTAAAKAVCSYAHAFIAFRPEETPSLVQSGNLSLRP